MNRIILIGNGFDLAHGMQTSYGDFINNYWGNKRKEVLDTKYYGKTYQDENVIIERVPPLPYCEAAKGESEYTSFLASLRYNKSNIKYQNKFLEILTKKNYSLNWVDIEKEYYSLLKKSFRDFSLPIYKITDLNKHFQSIESLLEEYLTGVEKEFTKNFPNSAEEKSFKKAIHKVIYSDFNLRDFSESSINQLAEIEFQRVYNDIKSIEEGHKLLSGNELSDRELRLYQALIGQDNKKQKLKKLLISETANNYFRHRPKEVLFVNFNYTSTEVLYDNPPTDREFGKDISTDVIHIHGVLNNKTDNKVIFGFGDEIDKDYLEIEHLDDNEYLQNIKSMKYLESDSYKKLLDFINSNNYQVFIFGHSCGISDRTLLNTLFEHKNCSSVKPYYRQKNDGTDNYSEMIRNISRNFTDKASMRDKVVNKKFTEALFR